jgi:sulfide dehydrogenase [flavocytochrome c] flavoprotein subunit
MSAQTEFGEEKADVINYIPPQQAGAIARESGLTDDSGWCPVDTISFESAQAANVHIIGDASIAAKMPKSGFSANSQGKIAAAAALDLLAGRALRAPSFANTCYSFVAPEYAISVAAVYKSDGEKIAAIKGAGGVSPRDAGDDFRRREADYARGWYASITADMFA